LSATANLQTFSVFAIWRIRCRGQERFLCAYVCRPFTQPTFTCSVDVSDVSPRRQRARALSAWGGGGARTGRGGSCSGHTRRAGERVEHLA
jgi:hypothetical protein